MFYFFFLNKCTEITIVLLIIVTFILENKAKILTKSRFFCSEIKWKWGEIRITSIIYSTLIDEVTICSMYNNIEINSVTIFRNTYFYWYVLNVLSLIVIINAYGHTWWNSHGKVKRITLLKSLNLFLKPPYPPLLSKIYSGCKYERSQKFLSYFLRITWP